MRSLFSFWTLALFALAACGNRKSEEREAPPSRAAVSEPSTSAFEALPTQVSVQRAKMRLGRRLFHDTQLSGDNTVSCATCHQLDHGGAEARRTSLGIRQQQGPINAPTVFNAAYQFRQFWDGRAADLEEQAAGPVENPIEMGAEWASVLSRLKGDETYVQAFRGAFSDGAITKDHVTEAIAEYERFLVTPSPWDRYLRGERSALNDQQRRGFAKFSSVGCPTCHNGRLLGGSSYQRMGLVHNYFEARGGEVTEADLGRFNVTHDDADRHKFKVPTLRNVALTPPYFHDGSRASLEHAVRDMGYFQLGQRLSDSDIADIVAFLQSTTGEIPRDARPAAPAPAAGSPT